MCPNEQSRSTAKRLGSSVCSRALGAAITALVGFCDCPAAGGMVPGSPLDGRTLSASSCQIWGSFALAGHFPLWPACPVREVQCGALTHMMCFSAGCRHRFHQWPVQKASRTRC